MVAKIQYASDLHLEFSQNRAFLKENPIIPFGDILVLAGDIVPFAVLNKHNDFFLRLADQYEQVYWLPGNHEYYGFDAAQRSGVLKESIRSNVFLVNNMSVTFAGVRHIFSTLWTQISLANQWLIERRMNDFYQIKFKGYRFSGEHYNQLHQESLAFIQRELKMVNDEQVAVFTHHCPTFMNYPGQFKGDVLNEAFAVELHDFIAESRIACWVYGHHHTNTSAFKIGKTRLVTNQLGYVQQNEHGYFDTQKVIEL